MFVVVLVMLSSHVEVKEVFMDMSIFGRIDLVFMVNHEFNMGFVLFDSSFYLEK